MRRALTAALMLVVIPTLALLGCATSRSGDEPELGILLDRVVAAGAPGVLVVVREDGKVRSEARGFADRSRSIRMRGDERFRIGSITKTFVATLVLLLVEDGALRLDDTVERWLPGLVPAGREMTVRDLLSHTSGLFDYVEDDRVLRDHERRWTPRELVSIAVAHPPERSPPGRSFAYSSTNYIVLGLIAEEAGGASLSQQLRRRLFTPLGLRHTSFNPGAIRGLHVHGHRSPSHDGVVRVLPPIRAPSPLGGRGRRPRSSRLRATSSTSSLPSCMEECSARRFCARWRHSYRRAACSTASESPPSRHHASLPGDTRETSRARSPSPGTRRTRLASSSSS